jgi:hypothetical protein
MARAPSPSPADPHHRHYVVAGPIPLWFFPVGLFLLGVFIGQVNMSAILVAYGHRELNIAFCVTIVVSAFYFIWTGAVWYMTAVKRLPSEPLLAPIQVRFSPGWGKYQYLVAADRLDRWLLPTSLVCQGWSASMAAAHFSGSEWRATGITLVYVGQLLALPGSIWHLLSIRWERLYEYHPLATSP